MAPAPGPGASTAGVPLTLDQLSSANAGQVVTVHAVVQSEAGACTQSVPPSCTGTLRLFPTRSAKAPRVELHGSYAGAQIRCSFPANGPSTCHPAIELGVAYAITGTVTVGGGGLQIEPTAIDRL